MSEKKSPVSTGILVSSILGAALLAIAGFSAMQPTGEQSKLVYDGKLWCVSNYLEQEPQEILSDGRPRQDKLLDDKQDWIVREQVSADSKAEAEKIAQTNGHGLFEPSDKVTMRATLAKTPPDKAFFTSHFNQGATIAGPCLGGGSSQAVGMWLNDRIRQDCFGIEPASSTQASTAGGASSGKCEIKNENISLRSWGTVSLPASGKIVKEDHLVTKEEGFSPSGVSDGIQNHYKITAQAIGRNYSHSGGWTPAEGGGAVGSGSAGRPPAASEPWVMNMYWTRKPAAGTKVIIKNPSSGKVVVAVAGYETGPSGTKWLLGAQEEVLQAIGARTNTTVTVGFAEDQSLPLGPINCISQTSQPSPTPTPTPTPSASVTRDPKCPTKTPASGPSTGSDLQQQIATQLQSGLDTANQPDANDQTDSNAIPENENLPNGVLNVPPIDESQNGLVGHCNRAAAGMAYLYRVGKTSYSGIGAWLNSLGATVNILGQVKTGVVDRKRAATSDNWAEIRDQVVNKKNPVVLATNFGGHKMHYITITGFVGSKIYFNDGAHFVANGSGVAGRWIEAGTLSSHLQHSTDGYRFLYAKPASVVAIIVSFIKHVV